MSVLRPRTLVEQDAKTLRDYPMLRGFHAPQRDRAAKVQHPQPKRTAA